MTSHSGKMEALLCWVNSLKVDEPIKRFSQLQDLSILLKVVGVLSGNSEETAPVLQQNLEQRLNCLCSSLQRYCQTGSSAQNLVQWQKILQGENLEVELSKVIVILFYYSTMSSKNPRKSEDIDHKTQTELASILRFVLDNEDALCLDDKLINFLKRKAPFASSGDDPSSSSDAMTPNVSHRRKSEVRFLQLHSVASSSTVKSLSADSPSSPMIEVLHTPQFQMRRLKKQLSEVRECRDELEVELAENRKNLAEKEAQISLLQQQIENLRILRENQTELQEPKELEELREKNESLMIRLRDTLKQCQDMKADKKLLERKNDQLAEENGELSYKVRDLSNRLAQLQEALYETTEEQELSLSNWQQKQNQLESELSGAVGEKKYLEEHNLILQGKISMLEDQLKEMGEIDMPETGDCMGDILKLDDLKQELAVLNTQCLSLKEQIHQMEEEKSTAEVEMEAQKSRFESEKGQLQEIVTNLQTSLSEITFQKERLDNEARAQQEHLMCQITTLKLEISKLKSSLVHKDEELKGIHHKVEEERNEKNRLLENFKMLEESSKKNMQELIHKVENLGSSLKVSEGNLIGITQQLESKTKEVDYLREQQQKILCERDSTLSTLNEYKCKKDEEFSVLNKTVKTLEQDHQTSLSVIEKLKSEKEELASKVQDLDAKILDLIAKCQNLDSENDSQSKSHAATVESLKAQLSEQESQLKIYQKKVSSNELVSEENSKLKDQLLSVEESLRHLREHLEKEKTKFAASLDADRKKISDLEKEMKKLSESRDEALRNLDEERTAGKKIESQLKHLEEKYQKANESLQAKLAGSCAAIKQREEERDELSKVVDIWKAKYGESQQKIAQNSCQMQEQIEELKNAHADAYQKLERERSKVLMIEAQAGEAKSSHLEEINQLEDKLSEANTRIKEREVEEKKLLSALNSAEEKLKIAYQEESEHLSHLETGLSNANHDLDCLAKELSDEKHKKAELEAMVKELKEQNSERIASLESELKTSLAAVKNGECEIGKLSGELEHLKRQLNDSSQKHKEALAQKNIEIKQLIEAKEKATSDLAIKSEMDAQLQKAVDTHKSEFSALQNELSRSLDLLALKEGEVERLNKEAALRQEEIQQQQQTITKLTEEETALAALKDKVALQEKEIKQQVQATKGAEEEMAKLKSVISEKSKRIECLEQDIQNQKRDLSCIQEQHQRKLGESQGLQALIADLEKKCKEQKELICEAQNKAAEAKTLASEKASVSERQLEGIQALEIEINKERQKACDLQRQLELSWAVQEEKETELQALKKELFHKVQELEQSQKSFTDSSGELSSMLSEAQERQQALTEAKEQAEQCQKEIDMKNKEVNSLQAEIKILSSKVTTNEEVSVDFEQRLLKETSKSAKLEEKMQKLHVELEASFKELLEKNCAIDCLTTEAQNLKGEADQQRMAVDSLQQKLSSKAETNHTLQQEIQAWQKNCAEKEQQICSLQQNLKSNQSLLEEFASLKRSYQEIIAERDLMQEKHQEELLSHKKLTERFQAELEKAKEDMTEIVLLKEKLHNQELQLHKFQSENSYSLTQISHLQQVNSQLLGANQSLSQISDQGAKKLESEMSTLKEQHKEEMKTLRLQYEKTLREGNKQVQETSLQLETVTSKYDHVKSKVLKDQKTFQEEKQRLLLQVEELTAAKKEQSEQVQELNKQLSQQEKTIRSQQQKLKQREGETHEEADKSHKRVLELESQLEQQIQAVEHYKAQMEKAKVHYDAKKKQNQELSEELQSHIKQQEHLSKENADLKAKSEQLHKELQHSLLQSKEVEQNCKNLSNRVRSLEAQLEYTDRQLRDPGKFQLATDSMKSRDTFCAPRQTRSHADVSIDSLDLSFGEDQLMNSTSERCNEEPATSSVHVSSPDSLISGQLPKKVESLESLYFTPIPTRAQSKLESSIGSIGDLSLDSSKKTQSARRRTMQIINITMTKKTKEEPEPESANTSFYSLRSAPSYQSLHLQNPRRAGRPPAAISAPALASLPSQESLAKTEHFSSDDSLNNLPGYQHPTRRSARLSQTGGRSSFYMSTCQDEPDPQDDWTRIAELQARNKTCPPHLKTSYPLESRPSIFSSTITDEEVKLGDPKETLRRATLLPGQIQDSMTSTRRQTLAVPGAEHLKGHNISTRQQMKRVSEESHYGPDTPEAKKTATCFPRPMTPKDKHDARRVSTMESKGSSSHQAQPTRRQATAFSIFNTPKKLGNSLLKRGLNKKTTPKNSPRGRGANGSTSSTSNKPSHLSLHKSPSRRSPRVSTAKSPRASNKVGQELQIQLFERKQQRNK
ncbi:nuclear mitotic apparatus protein 1 S homeolog isoform X2 [Xenopus laevis]|uniref:Nuclear mitotic apparatus protein 1 S homeolog isoform X2 n=1 Tax=Xenopus laevis TaxID=8355 RepID=A0A8J0UHX8_XENLA|nr:nuclear mitotic apparatus protein 1 S homeolog isoform X2 [Xenopus laevis]